ncbi:MAG: Crp/Fnr family transcriptional regulator [Bacteroidales bacterium]|jgi:CRP-like cAMP-binding protein|nr:Crp/Fnr family transcriptional regulator [Bacteroidales bacterium]
MEKNISNSMINYGWMEHLNEKEKEEVLNGSALLTYNKGETIIKQGTLASQILFVEDGIAKLNLESVGRDTTFSFATNGDFIGLMCSFVKKKLDFSAIAITQTTVRMIERDVFEKLIENNGKFAVYIVKHMSELTNSVVHTLITLSHKNVNGAVATLLLTLSRLYQSNNLQIPFSRDEMADALGYSKESIINTLSALHQDKIISVSGRELEILQHSALGLIAEKG